LKAVVEEEGCRGRGMWWRISFEGFVDDVFFIVVSVFSGICGVYRGVFLVVSVVLLEWIQWSEHTAISKLEIVRDFSLQAGSRQPQCHA
jgi:hypothetical protein